MKKIILKATAVGFALAVAGALGCGSSGGGCGGSSTPATTAQVTCGQGTYQVNGQCVVDPGTGSSGSSGGTTGSNVQATPSNSPQAIQK